MSDNRDGLDAVIRDAQDGTLWRKRRKEIQAEIAALKAKLAEAEKESKRLWDATLKRDAELHAGIGALEDAGVRRNDSDEIASGIAKLAQDRDGLLAEWNAVGSIFWPNREPDDGWSHREIADEVKGLRERAKSAERHYQDLRRVIDGGSESMTHEDAVREVGHLTERAEAAEALLEDAVEIVSEHASGFSYWLGKARALLSPARHPEPEQPRQPQGEVPSIPCEPVVLGNPRTETRADPLDFSRKDGGA